MFSILLLWICAGSRENDDDDDDDDGDDDDADHANHDDDDDHFTLQTGSVLQHGSGRQVMTHVEYVAWLLTDAVLIAEYPAMIARLV